MKKLQDTNMSLRQRREFAWFIGELSIEFCCLCFDYNYENHISDMCGTASTFGFGYV